MNCPKCGASNPSDVQFCTSCGEQMAKPVNGTKDPAKKKLLFIILGAAAVLIVLIIAIATAFSGDGATDAADDLCDAIIDMDANAAMKFVPPAVKEYVSNTLSLDEASAKILDSEPLSADEVKDIDELYARYFDTGEGYVDAATRVRVEIRVPDKKLTKNLIPLIMIKVDGKWYLDILQTSREMKDVDWVFGGFNFVEYINK